jgi:hypothetical protein
MHEVNRHRWLSMCTKPRTHGHSPSVRRRNSAVIDGESVKKKAMIGNILQLDREDEVPDRLIVHLTLIWSADRI